MINKLLLNFALWYTKESKEKLGKKFALNYFITRSNFKSYYLTVFK